ncbi:MAG TPA: Hsp70 family protein, partial [Polyangiaceae bacterium]
REESVAFTLGDADFMELDSTASPPSSRTLAGYGTAAPSAPGALDDEDALPLPELPDEEITHVTAPPEPSAPRSASPLAGLFGGGRMQTVTLAQPTPMAAIAAPPAQLAPPSPAAPPVAPAYVAPPPPSFAPQRTTTLAFAPAPAAPTASAPQAPAAAPYGGFENVSMTRSMPPTPLLIDVTPLSLAVETVNGFCDAVIERNTQVPCECTRVFVTAVDHQTLVRVRISQGESSRFAENTLLGEVELSGLNPAPRGETQIAVSFSLDTNGMLSVHAKDVATGRATSTQVRLIALPESAEIARMIQRHAARH